MHVIMTLGQISNVFSYPTSLLFSYIISSKSSINFPGLVFLLVGFYQFAGAACHYYMHGIEGFILVRKNKNDKKKKLVDTDDDTDDDSKDVNDPHGLKKSLVTTIDV